MTVIEHRILDTGVSRMQLVLCTFILIELRFVATKGCDYCLKMYLLSCS